MHFINTYKNMNKSINIMNNIPNKIEKFINVPNR